MSEVCKVEMAHRYMWRPYLERARASIWSQYVIFMMTDYAMVSRTELLKCREEARRERGEEERATHNTAQKANSVERKR